MSNGNRTALLGILASALALGSSPVGGTVVPAPPPYSRDVSFGLQDEIIRRLGPGMNMRLHRSIGAIAVSGDYFGSRRKPTFNLLLRDQRGWTSWRTGSPRRLPAAVGAEIDRLLKGDTFWQEDGFVYGYPCPGIGRVMQVFHRGRDKLSRQPCSPRGLAGRLADLAASERVPAGPAPPVGGRSEMINGARGSDYDNKLPTPADPDAAQLILFLTMQSIYALREGDIERHVETYASDVTMVWPDGTERGRNSLRRRASAQFWNGVERRNLQPGEVYLQQTGPDRFVLTGTCSYWDGSRALNFPVTTRWERRGGIWQITHQHIRPAQPIGASAAPQPAG